MMLASILMLYVLVEQTNTLASLSELTCVNCYFAEWIQQHTLPVPVVYKAVYVSY